MLTSLQYEHQKLALTWLKSMEEGTNKGGILADDMGLGKTISALALILTRPSEDLARKVCPQIQRHPSLSQLNSIADYSHRWPCRSRPPVGEGDPHKSQGWIPSEHPLGSWPKQKDGLE